MKRQIIFFALLLISFLASGISMPESFTIVDLNTPTLLVGNKELEKGKSFNSDATIHWQSRNQAALVQDDSGQLYYFTKEAFEEKSVKTPKEYLLTGKFSTRSSLGKFSLGKNKSSFPEKRVALVIGNSNYISRADFLRAAVSDAQMISETLVNLGFDTYTKYDVSSAEQFKAVASFSEVAEQYDIALFYYAGHGFSYRHENYYQPIDVSEIDAASVHNCLAAYDLMDDLSGKAANGTILVIDACRSIAKVRGDENFAPIEALSGMMVFCSTSDGKTAIDAIGEYSPFAKAFSENISSEGLSISEVARKTRNDVRIATFETQTPTYSEKLYDDFYFTPQAVQPKQKQMSQPITVPITTPTNCTISGHEYVDLGLPSGTLWATCNVGASSPSDYGSYFAWGETSPKDYYDWSTLKYCNDDSGYVFSKYNKDQSGYKDNKMKLDFWDDAVRLNWGGGWRMPTKKEWKELKKECIWRWTRQGDHDGYIVTAKNGKSIFLPAAGSRYFDKLYGVGFYGEYWSSNLKSGCSYRAEGCEFHCSGFSSIEDANRCCGRSVRPVSSSFQ